MARTATLRRVGGSVMLAIPRPVLDELGVAADAVVALAVEDGRLVIDPATRPRYTLKQLLDRCDATARRPRDDRTWLDDKPAGRELI